MKKVLFVTEKWCDGNPEMGLTNHYHNLFGALKSTGLAEIAMAHYDEIQYNTGTHFDFHAKRIMDEHTPDVMVVSHWGTNYLNPSMKTYREAKKRGIKLVFTWPDTREWVLDSIKSLDIADLHVSWACEGDEPLCDKHVWLWTPEDPTLYFDDTKTTGVSFIGSCNGYRNVRVNYINYLLNNNIPIVVSGGQREHKLNAEEYARKIRTSKININFSESAYPGIHQCKGRVFESLASNSLLLESQNVATRRKLTPGVHYVEFTSEIDLKDKIQYYLKNVAEREGISKCGYEYFHQNYTPTAYWNIVFSRIL